MYLDAAASAPCDPVVTEKMMEIQAQFDANPSSVHSAGIRASREVEMARERLASRLGCEPDEIVFTGGATEANNLALKGLVWASESSNPHVVISAIEHPSILEVATWLKNTGQARLTILPVDPNGQVSPGELEDAIDSETVLVSVMHANNELGVLQVLPDLIRICRDRGVLFHTDASQSFLKVPIDVGALGIDLLTVSGHKIHGPKGVGMLYVRSGVNLSPLLHGGDHESGLRSGTLNVAAIAGFGVAVVRYSRDDLARIEQLRDALLQGLRDSFPELREHGNRVDRVPTVVNFALPGRSGKELAKALDRKGILVSASSACHSARLLPSHVLKAIGLTDEEADEAIRVSLGRFTTAEDVVCLVSALQEITAADSGSDIGRKNEVLS